MNELMSRIQVREISQNAHHGQKPAGLDAAMRSKLSFFRNSLIKRFPECSANEIDATLDRTLKSMHPSRDRTLLKRLIVPVLAQRELRNVNGGAR